MLRLSLFSGLLLSMACAADTDKDGVDTVEVDEVDDSDPPVEDTDVEYVSRLDGEIYELDFSTATLVEPRLGSEFLGGTLGERRMVVQFADDGGDVRSISALTTADTDGVHTQEPCSRTVVFDDEIGWSDPALTISVTDFFFDVQALSVPIQSMDVSATLSNDGAVFTDFAVSAYIDSADFPPTPEGGDTPCDLVSIFGIECQPCEDDPTREECLRVEIDGGILHKVELSSDLVEITTADLAAASDCAVPD